MNPNEREGADILAVSDVPVAFTERQVLLRFPMNNKWPDGRCWDLFEYSKNQSHSLRKEKKMQFDC